jgi:hypothetical protein
MKVIKFNLDVVTESNELIENKARLETIVDEIDKGGLTDRNYKELSDAYTEPIAKQNVPLWKKIGYIMFRPPITASFMGFIVGFITVIKVGIFNQKTIAFVKSINLAFLWNIR